MNFATRLAEVKGKLAAACARAGRPSESVTLIAVSKTHPLSAIQDALACGQTHFGENRVEEAAEKIDALSSPNVLPRPIWHMIGHVQSRKAKAVIGRFDVVHSLDSLSLAEKYARLAAEQRLVQRVLLEINISGEASKAGFTAHGWQTNPPIRESLWGEIGRIISLPGLQVLGLMTMAPVVEAPEAARPVFRALRLLRDALSADFPSGRWDVLSMGMTDDFEIAIEEGATMIRIGRALFGPRDA